MKNIRDTIKSINNNNKSTLKDFFYYIFDTVDKDKDIYLADSLLHTYFCFIPHISFSFNIAKEIFESCMQEDWIMLTSDIKYEVSEKLLPNGGFVFEKKRISKYKIKNIKDLCVDYKYDEDIWLSNFEIQIKRIVDNFDFTKWNENFNMIKELDRNFFSENGELKLSDNNRIIWNNFLLNIIDKNFDKKEVSDRNIIIKHYNKSLNFILIIEIDSSWFNNELSTGHFVIKPFKFFIQDKSTNLIYPISIYIPQRELRENIILEYNSFEVAKRIITNLESRFFITKKIIDVICNN